MSETNKFWRDILITKKDTYRYRILTKQHRIKFAGTDDPSWLTLAQAKMLVDHSKGEMIYQYDHNGEPLFEIL